MSEINFDKAALYMSDCAQMEIGGSTFRDVVFHPLPASMLMSESSITLILNQLRQAGTDEERQAAAAKLYRCYRGQVERVARTRLTPGGGLADEEDVAQSAFRSFFDRIETGQLDALVTGGQAWAILARLTRNKAIDSVRYDNALCRGGEGGRRAAEPLAGEPTKGEPAKCDPVHGNVINGNVINGNVINGDVINGDVINGDVINGDAAKSTRLNRLESQSGSTRSTGPRAIGPRSGATAGGRNRLPIGDGSNPSSSRIEFASQRVGRKREDYPLDAVRDKNQRSGAEQAASNEAIERFLEQLSEATLRGIVSLKLHGFTNEEIAEQLGCATRTVERKLNLIRRLWSPILENSDEHRPT